MKRELREFHRLERACREQAAIASLELERDALIKVAEDYRRAINSLMPASALDAGWPVNRKLPKAKAGGPPA